MQLKSISRDEKIVIALIISIILILSVLYAYELKVEPAKINIGDISKHIGDYVEIKGIVWKSKNVTNGMILYIYDERFENKTEAYLQFSANIFPGALVKVRGQVVSYRGTLEVIVYKPQNVEIIEKYFKLQLPEVLQAPQHYVGMNIELSGNLSNMYMSDYFEVTDGFTILKVYIKNGYFGERNIYIYGMYKNGIFYAKNITLDTHRNCTKLSELSNNEGKYVWIHATIISYFYYGWLEEDGYAIKVVSDERIASGEVNLEGKLIYNAYDGEYVFEIE